MVLVQNKYKNSLVGVLGTKITFVSHSSPSCYVTLRTQVIRLNSGNLSPQKTNSGVFIILLGTPQKLKNIKVNGSIVSFTYICVWCQQSLFCVLKCYKTSLLIMIHVLTYIQLI